MRFEEMKTLTALLQPVEDGWQVMHKKYKTPYGSVRCEKSGSTVKAVLEFGEYEDVRREAAEAVLRALFEEDDVQCVVLDGEPVTRDKWQAMMTEKYAPLHRTREDYADVLGKSVHCVMDRPLGSAHPRYPDMIYPVNYGYVPGLIAGDNAEQDVYVLGPTEPLESFDGVVIAVIHRFDDCEDKWVAAEKTGLYSEEEIRQILRFQEKYYISEILM